MSTPAIDIPTTFGALLIGALFASVISGISDLQAMFYFKSYRNDSMRMKLLVAVVWLLDLVHTGFVWGAVWFYLIDHYGDGATIDRIAWGIPMTIVDTGLITVFVDCFFAHRIFLLSKRNWFLAAPVVVLVFLRLCVVAVTAAKMFTFQRFSLVQQHDSWLFTLGLAVGATLDVVTSALLVYLLLIHRTENGRFNHVLDKLMLYGLETGSLTCIGSVTSMLCWIFMPHNLIFMGLYFCIGKFYANSLFTTLNTRNNILHQRSTSSGEQGRGPILFLEPRSGRTEERGQFSVEPSTKIPAMSLQDFQINVQTERTIHYDEGSIESQKS